MFANGKNSPSGQVVLVCKTLVDNRFHSSSASLKHTMTSLATRVHGLPQELINEIHKLTFIVEPAIVTIDRKSCKVPSIIQVDKSSRSTTARLYYSQNVFEGLTTVVQDLVTSIPYEHAEHLTEVRLEERPLVCRLKSWKAGTYPMP